MDGHLYGPNNRAHDPPVLSGQEENLPLILKLADVAAYFNRRPSTIYEWIARGLLDATYRKRGKHHFFWRDKVTKLKLEYEENEYETQ
ncbi:hypothetical protein V6x_41990 [Gimesia chilikensis]|uniref:Helix-turn-helix domain-containing protein n=1 Tax=Gimesia chilikensis TaxID=2605989 RepID=A0A517WGU0_9PLAN|nr:helix-turn-helix domain-containing protein [Gimesia chilikensis]QDU04471.1 hypothetical protein V6x_41990 [Gimesia chilikensis]